MVSQVDAKERRWAITRLALGLLQMGGAVTSLVLLVQLGISPLSLSAVALTSVCTALSVLLFGSRSPSREVHHRKN